MSTWIQKIDCARCEATGACEIDGEHELCPDCNGAGRIPFAGRTCDACRHWASNPLSRDHVCVCPAIKFVGDHQGRRPKDFAFLKDAEDYNASFHPGPKFGCVHWQAKPD